MVGTGSSGFGLNGQLSLTMALVMSVVAAPTEVAAQGTPNGGKTVVGAWFNPVTPTSVAPFVGLEPSAPTAASPTLPRCRWPHRSRARIRAVDRDCAWHLRRHVPHDHGRRGRSPSLTSKVRANLRIGASGDEFAGSSRWTSSIRGGCSSAPIPGWSPGRGSRSNPCRSCHT